VGNNIVEKHILRRMQFDFNNHEYGNCYKIQSLNFRVTHSQST
jgi:hypothetical protein